MSVSVGEVTATIDARPSLIQHYDTAMRRTRLAHTQDAWRKLVALDTRHHRTGTNLRKMENDPALAAWLHALDASPWVLPYPDFHAHVTSAYTCARSDLTRRSSETGALALAEDARARVVRISTVGEAHAWLTRIGPIVIDGWMPVDYVVKRDSEVITPTSDMLAPHVMAVFGAMPGCVRVVNNRGAVWGSLGRAWMPNDMLARVLDDGAAWGFVPVDLKAKSER